MLNSLLQNKKQHLFVAILFLTSCCGDPSELSTGAHSPPAGRKRDIPMGTHVRTVDDARKRIAQGFRFVAVAEAGRMMQHTAREVLKQVRE